jgi:hypothetical protein
MLSAADIAVDVGFGTFLIWGGATAIRVLGGLVIAPRPAAFVLLRRTAIWAVGATAILAGLAMAAHGLAHAV